MTRRYQYTGPGSNGGAMVYDRDRRKPGSRHLSAAEVVAAQIAGDLVMPAGAAGPVPAGQPVAGTVQTAAPPPRDVSDVAASPATGAPTPAPVAEACALTDAMRAMDALLEQCRDWQNDATYWRAQAEMRAERIRELELLVDELHGHARAARADADALRRPPAAPEPAEPVTDAAPTSDDDDYNARPGIRWTRLAMMRRSPRHYLSGSKAPTQSLQRGTLVHCMVLEPDQVAARYAVWSERRGTKAHKAFLEEHAGRQIVTAREYDAAQSMARAIRDHVSGGVRMGDLIDECIKETVVEWTDPTTGLALKAKIDLFHAPTNTIWDIKTLRDIEARALGNASHRYGYPGQLAHYADGAHRAGLAPSMPACGLVVVEVDSLDVGQIDLSETDQAAGLKLRDELLARVVECTSSGEWPGLYPERAPLMLPAYAYAEAELDFTGADP